MTSSAANPLPFALRDLASQPPHVARDSVANLDDAIVCRTVTVRADGPRLQAELERELRALLGLDDRRRN